MSFHRSITQRIEDVTRAISKAEKRFNERKSTPTPTPPVSKPDPDFVVSTPVFKAAVQSTPSSPRARKLIELYNSIPGASGPYCNPHSLAAVIESLRDWEDMADLAAELRGEAPEAQS